MILEELAQEQISKDVADEAKKAETEDYYTP